MLRLAHEHGASGERLSTSTDGKGEEILVLEMEITNRQVGGFIAAALDVEPRARFSFAPAGVVALEAPLDSVAERVRDVSPRSALELVIGALQSLGSWRGLLLYATCAGIVAAYAVIFNIPYLLTAAMLISPMGGPAMVCAIALTVGDAGMLRRGAIRFWVAIGVLSLAAAATAAAYRLEFSTEIMELISSLSTWVILIAITGGAAGALAQVQSERDSLVTATATGFLVAVSLSPPAAVLGLGVVIGRWDYVAQMAVLLLLTFFGILLGGAVTLAGYGVGPGSPPSSRGSTRQRTLAGAAVLAGAAALFFFQHQQAPEFRKADLSRDAARLAREVVRESAGYRLLRVDAAFTRPDLGLPTEALLVEVMVAAEGEAARPGDAESRLQDRIAETIRTRLPGVEPFVEVTALRSRFQRENP